MIKNLSGRQFWILMLAWSVSTVGWAETGVTNIINGFATNSAGTIFIGNTGPFNTFVVTNGGTVTATMGAIIGSSGSASNNVLIVTDTGSSWTSITGGLEVGTFGSSNGLMIANGGHVNSLGDLGGTTTSSNNWAVVTGAGSTWSSASSIAVGNFGGFNTLTITNGGLVADNAGYVGGGFGAATLAANNNSVLVTGTGSIWTNSGNLYVGFTGSFNQLTIANSGRVDSLWGSIGQFSNNNAVLVSGTGSLWHVTGDLFLGHDGANNSLTLTNGGHVTIGGGMTIGYASGATNNQLVVNGTGSVWSGLSDVLAVGNFGGHNGMTVTNGGQVLSGWGRIGAAGDNNAVLVSGAGSVWSNVNQLWVGNNGSGNSLTIANNGTVYNGDGYIGNTASSTNNSVLVTGTGSSWINSGNLYAGFTGSFNNLTLSNSALVANQFGFVGYSAAAGNNSVVVDHSVWTNSWDLDVGFYGSGNSLLITNGGQVISRAGTIGFFANANSNSVTVTDAGSLWNIITTNLAVGYTGSFNRLTVANGGQVLGQVGYIGYGGGSMSNSVLVTGAGSLWSNSVYLFVGTTTSSFNNLTISNNGLVISDTGIIGNYATCSNNSALVTAGGVWTNKFDLQIGGQGSSNSLIISNGGRVIDNNNGYIGVSTTASNNSVLVTGAGSVWSNGSYLEVGFMGSSNSLTIANGGHVFNNSNSLIGDFTTASNNWALVTGSGSVWSNRAYLEIGAQGSFNSLTIANSGQVFSATGLVGNLGSFNTAVVTGTGSVWTATTIGVGISGSNNQLRVLNGGQVVAATVGAGGFSGNANSLLVDGIGSVVDNSSGMLLLGAFGGNNNSLTITNGGTVLSMSSFVGNAMVSTGNWALVTGSGSVWSNSQDLYVGELGSGNHLTIANSGRVYSLQYGEIGDGTTASNNWALVTGTGSVWYAGSMVVGDFGSSNNLTIANGGQVISGTAAVGDYSNAFNSAVVTGSNSLWVSSLFGVGYLSSSSNQVSILNGGAILSSTGAIGFAANANHVLVDGTGSIWSNSSDLLVGVLLATNNSLTITNGGHVLSANGQIGLAGGANSNWVLVTGSGSLWSNSANLYIGNTGSFNQLTIANSGTVLDAVGYIGNDGASSNNSVMVTGPGALWTNSGNLYIGYGGSSNRLTIANGGRVADVNGFIDPAMIISSSNNYVLVTGTGSVWNNSGDLYVGNSGAGNQLVITNGGTVIDNTGFIGNRASSFSNSVLVTGSGSLWTNSTDIYIGNTGSFNQLTIANGGQVFSSGGEIGSDGSASNNSVLITGTGSAWTMGNHFSLGGVGSSLSLTNGGQLSDYDSRMMGSNGTVWISGSQSTWSNEENFSVGINAGSSNHLTVNNGGQLISANGFIGSDTGANYNTVMITGTGSVWTAGQFLNVGAFGNSNQMTIAHGGQVTSQYGGIGGYLFFGPVLSSGANGNSAVITDAGSRWDAQILVVGYGASGNSLSVLNGGTLNSTNIMVVGFSGNSNSVLVSGPGSTLLSYDLYIGGFMGSTTNIGNSLTIDQGGSVTVSNDLFLVNGDFAGLHSSNNSLNLNAGTLTTYGGSTIMESAGSNFVIGTTAGQTAAWNILGGNNQILGNTILGGAGSAGVINFVAGGLDFGGNLSVGTLGSGLLSIQTGLVASVAGNYTQGANGILQLAIGGTNASQYSQVTVGTNATLNGTLRVVGAGGFVPAMSNQVTILTAGGTVSGTFSTFDNQITGPVRARLIYDPSDVILEWDQLSFLSFALTPNQRAVARALDSGVTDPRASALIAYLDTLSTNQLPGAFDLISPSQLTAIFSLGFAGAEVQGWNLLSRVRELRSGMGGFSANSFGLFDPTGKMNDLPQFAANNMDPAQQLAMNQGALARSKDNPWGVFVSGAGEFAGVQGNAEASGYHLTTAGMTVGADYRFNDQFVLGVAMGYGSTYAGLSGDGRIDVDSARGNLYGVWFNEGWHVEGSFGGGYNIYDTKRATLGGAAKADATGTELEGMLGTGYDWQNGPWTFGPYATLQYTTIGINSFNEKGSLAPLHIQDQDQDSLRSLAGAHLAYRTKAGSIELMPDVHAGWQHEFFSQRYGLDSSFASGAGNAFRVHGPGLGSDSAVVGCGLSVKWSETISTYVNYNTELGRSNFDLQSVSAGIRLSF